MTDLDLQGKKFSEHYNALVAGLNQQNRGSLLWWCTDLASKNTTAQTCLLPQYLQSLKDPQRFEGPDLACTLARAKKIAGLFWFALKMYVRALLSRRWLGQKIAEGLNRQKPWYVIKTFSYDSSFDAQGRYHDAFFGRLVNDLSAQKNVLLFVNVLGNFPFFLKQAKSSVSGPLLVPLEFFLTFKDICSAVKEVLTFKVQLPGTVLFDGRDVKPLVRYELYRAFNGVQVSQLLHYHCTRGLAQKCAVDTFLMTYENNPWERMCTLSLRRFSPKTQIIGYQHAVVPFAALNMFLHPQDQGTVPLPDRILTVGEITAQLLNERGHYPPGLIKTACGLRYEYLDQTKAKFEPWRGQVLVVLDGVKNSSQLLEYVLSQFQEEPGIEVLIRPHPALPRDHWQKRYGRAIDRLPNVHWSQQTLPQDLQWADAVVYWQSTVAWEALALGRGVINFVPQDILSYDPLLDFSFLRWQVCAQDPLMSVLERIRTLPLEEKQRQYGQARDLINRYFYPVTDQSFKDFL